MVLPGEGVVAQTDQRQGGAGKLLGGVRFPPERELHVGLPGGEPDIPDEDIPQPLVLPAVAHFEF